MPTYQRFEVNWTPGYDFNEADNKLIRINSDDWGGYYNIVFNNAYSPSDFIESDFLPVLRAALGENAISVADGPNVSSDKFDFLVVYEGTLSNTELADVQFSIASILDNKSSHNLVQSTITNGESPSQTIQVVSIGTATQGSFTVTTDEGAFTVYIEFDEYSSWINAVALQADIDFTIGINKYVVTQPGGVTTSVTLAGYSTGYQGAFYISNNATNGTPSVSVTSHGSDGEYEQQDFYFSPSIPDYSINITNWNFIGHAIAYNANASDVEYMLWYYAGMETTVTGSGSEADPFQVYWDTFGPVSDLSPISAGENYWYEVQMAITDSYFIGGEEDAPPDFFMACAT